MFGRLYVGELKKQAKPKTVIVVSILAVVFFILSVVVYSLLADALSLALQDAGIDDIGSGFMDEQILDAPSADNIDQYIEAQKKYIEELKSEKTTALDSFLSQGDELYQAESDLALLEYRKANNDYDTAVYAGGLSILDGASAEGFLSLFLSMFCAIVCIAGIAIGSGIVSTEIKEGTLKLMFMRPVTRNQVITAKLFALLSIVSGLMVVGTLIGYVYGVAAYGAAKNEAILFIFNASTVTKGTTAGGTTLMWANLYISVLAYSILGFSLGTITKNRTAGLVIGILIYFGILSSLFSVLKIGAFTFESSVGFLNYIGSGMGIPSGGNFYIAFFMFVAYISALLAVTYLVFDKRDLA